MRLIFRAFIAFCVGFPSACEAKRPVSITPIKCDRILAEARYPLVVDGEPAIDSDTIRRIGALPVETVSVSNATYHLSKPYPLDDYHHQIAVAFVEVDDRVWTRVLYRSNSQFTWRMCDARNDHRIGKGFHESDKQIPIKVTAALNRRAGDVGNLSSAPGFAEPSSSQSQRGNALFRSLTADFRGGHDRGDVLQVGHAIVTPEYDALMPRDPEAFSPVKGELITPSGIRVAEPAKTELPETEKLPNLAELIDSFSYTNEAYAAASGTTGLLHGRVYHSFNGDLQYLFYEDPVGRVVLSGVEMLDAEVNQLGLRSRYLDLSGTDAPLMEYAFQIPKQYGGRPGSEYLSNWAYVSALPIIQYFYVELGKAMPEGRVPPREPAQHASANE